MSATKYTFSISVDFPYAKVSTDRLNSDIRTSTITIALDYINTSGDDCDVWFKDALDGKSAITAVDQGTKTFTITGDHTGDIAAEDSVTVRDSTGNNGLYTVVSATLDGSDTDVVVSEAIPDTTADGDLGWNEVYLLAYLVSIHSGEPLPNPLDSDGVPIYTMKDRQEDGAARIVQVGRIGSDLVRATHNLCDRTTWYTDSTQVESNAPTTSDDKIYTTGDTNLICITRGRVLKEHNLNGDYDVVVYADAVEVTIVDPLSVYRAAITAVDTGNKKFTLGDACWGRGSYVNDGDTLTVIGSTGNDKQYTVTDVVYDLDANTTTVTVSEAVASAVVDGYLNWATWDGEDCYVVYEEGMVIFGVAQTGSTITADYSKAGTSDWVIEPIAGKVLCIEDAEAQFADPVNYSSTVYYEVFGYVVYFAPEYAESNGGPLPDLTRIIIDFDVYRSIDQMVDEARGAYPYIPSIGGPTRGMHTPRFGFPFRYTTIRSLYSSLGMQLRCRLGGGYPQIGMTLAQRTPGSVPFGGERATASFYCTSKIEAAGEALTWLMAQAD